MVGLLLGGLLTDYLSWRWVMFINVPIALVVLIGTSVLIEGDRAEGGVDIVGGITVTLGLASLIYAINRVGTHGWSDRYTLIVLAATLVLVTMFVVVQSRSPVAMMPHRVVRDGGRVDANLVMFLVGGGMFATFYYLTLYMQVVRTFSPMQAGLSFLPFAIGIGLSAGGVGPKLLASRSERTVITIGLVIAIVGTIWLSAIQPGSNPFAALLPAQLVTGFGLGFAFVTATIVGVRGVPPQDTGIASGLLNTSQQVGGALGLAALAVVASVVATHMSPGTTRPVVLTHGFSIGFLVVGGIYLVALAVGLMTIGSKAARRETVEATG